MIKNLSIKNFKSIEHINIEFQMFNCIVGMNGAGKSTILQALDFVSQLMIGRMDLWLENRGWKASHLTNSNLEKRHRFIEIQLTTPYPLDSNKSNDMDIVWSAKFDTKELRCIEESVQIKKNDTSSLILGQNKDLLIIPNSSSKIVWTYQGSILSSLSETQLVQHKALVYLKKMLQEMIVSLELLSPAILRKNSRPNAEHIGIGGERLAGLIHDLKPEQRELLKEQLVEFYPNIVNIETKSLVGGWKALMFQEQYGKQPIKTEAIHIHDGLLRILAILTQIRPEHPAILLLDEIENGINQEIIRPLVRKLATQPNIQVITTTHSPLILNYLTDDEAVHGVFFAYKTHNGSMGIRRFFDVIDEPEMLKIAGPGEVYANTNLLELTDKCHHLDKEQGVF